MTPERAALQSDWSFDAEIVGFVSMAKAQIAVAMRDADAPVGDLAQLISDIGLSGLQMRAAVATLDDKASTAVAALANEIETLSARVREASVALQFHDRLVQRLTHAHSVLDMLGEVVSDRQSHRSQADWDHLRTQIRSQYSMEHERLVFDLLVGGASPEHVLEALQNLRETSTPDHADIF